MAGQTDKTASKADQSGKSGSFLAVLDALRETPGGDWFIGELAQHVAGPGNTVAPASPPEQEAVAELSRELAAHLKKGKEQVDKDVMREHLIAMERAIANTRSEIAAINEPEGATKRVDQATHELDAIIEATEGATSAILEVAEKMDDVAGRVAALDNGSKAAASESELINELSAEIFMACSFQDITGQRISKVVAVLKELERRTASLLGHKIEEAKDTRADAHLLNGPSAASEGGIDQDAVDALFG